MENVEKTKNKTKKPVWSDVEAVKSKLAFQELLL